MKKKKVMRPSRIAKSLYFVCVSLRRVYTCIYIRVIRVNMLKKAKRHVLEFCTALTKITPIVVSLLFPKDNNNFLGIFISLLFIPI